MTRLIRCVNCFTVGKHDGSCLCGSFRPLYSQISEGQCCRGVIFLYTQVAMRFRPVNLAAFRSWSRCISRCTMGKSVSLGSS